MKFVISLAIVACLSYSVGAKSMFSVSPEILEDRRAHWDYDEMEKLHD